MVLQKKVPILGICLGAQLMTMGSEEGIEKGLSYFNAKTIKFNDDKLITPHMGWNYFKEIVQYYKDNWITNIN
jgi:imidazole glycerol-phosphate synthase subunit HisH